jgi:hypothetical protein
LFLGLDLLNAIFSFYLEEILQTNRIFLCIALGLYIGGHFPPSAARGSELKAKILSFEAFLAQTDFSSLSLGIIVFKLVACHQIFYEVVIACFPCSGEMNWSLD